MVAGHLVGLFTVLRKPAPAPRSQRSLSYPVLAAGEVPGETSPLTGDAYPAALADAATELYGLLVEEGGRRSGPGVVASTLSLPSGGRPPPE